jgi:hypothetical protein
MIDLVSEIPVALCYRYSYIVILDMISIISVFIHQREAGADNALRNSASYTAL